MRVKSTIAVTAAYCVQTVYAHGYVPWLRINGATVVPGTQRPAKMRDSDLPRQVA